MHKLIVAFLLACSLAGCSTSSDEVTVASYKVLQTSATVYDTLMKASVNLHDDGVITDDQYAKIKESATAYYDTYNAAVDALLVYIETSDKEGKERLLSYIDLARANLNILLTLAQDCGIDLSSIGITYATSVDEVSAIELTTAIGNVA